MSQAYQIATPKYYGMLLCNVLSVIGWCCIVFRVPTLNLFMVVLTLSIIMTVVSVYQIVYHMRTMSVRTFCTYLIYVINGWGLSVATITLYRHILLNWFVIDIVTIVVILLTAVSWLLLEDR